MGTAIVLIIGITILAVQAVRHEMKRNPNRDWHMEEVD